MALASNHWRCSRHSEPGVDELVGLQGLENVEPWRAFARGAQALRAQIVQSCTERIDLVSGHRAGREQRPLPSCALIVHFDGLAPYLALAGVDLAQVQHLVLHNPAIAQAAALDHVPVVVGLAFLHPSIAAREHAPTPRTALTQPNDQSLHNKRCAESRHFGSSSCARPTARIPRKQRRLEKGGLNP